MSETMCTSRLRDLACELGQISRPDGSAVLTQGDTCAMSAVYGPAEVRINKEQIDKATVEVVYKPKSGLPGCVHKSYEALIRNTCETALLAGLHPRSAINITIQEVEDAGSFLAVCINSAYLALLDSSLGMRFMVAAVSCGIDVQGNLILDPVKKVEESCVATMTFVFDSVEKNVITVSAKGSYSKEQFCKCLLTCREATDTVFQFYKQTLNRKMSKTVYAS